MTPINRPASPLQPEDKIPGQGVQDAPVPGELPLAPGHVLKKVHMVLNRDEIARTVIDLIEESKAAKRAFRFEEAIDIQKQILELLPGNIPALLTLAEICLCDNQADKALETLEIIDRQLSMPDAYHTNGQQDSRLKRLRGRLASLTNASKRPLSLTDKSAPDKLPADAARPPFAILEIPNEVPHQIEKFLVWLQKTSVDWKQPTFGKPYIRSIPDSQKSMFAAIIGLFETELIRFKYITSISYQLRAAIDACKRDIGMGVVDWRSMDKLRKACGAGHEISCLANENDERRAAREARLLQQTSPIKYDNFRNFLGTLLKEASRWIEDTHKEHIGHFELILIPVVDRQNICAAFDRFERIITSDYGITIDDPKSIIKDFWRIFNHVRSTAKVSNCINMSYLNALIRITMTLAGDSWNQIDALRITQ